MRVAGIFATRGYLCQLSPAQAAAASYERWASVEGVCAHLGVARDTVYRWTATKRLPAHRLGRLWKFKIAEVDRWVRTESPEPME